MKYIILGKYENILETWEADNFEELILECAFIEESGWDIQSIFLALDEQDLLEVCDEENKAIIKAFVRGQPFTKKFIRTLYFEGSRRECLDYNETLKYLKHYESAENSFSKYIATMKTWYQEVE